MPCHASTSPLFPYTTLFRSEFLDSGDRAAKGALAESDAGFVEAERQMAKRDYVAADTTLTKVLETAPTAWLRRPEVLNYLQMRSEEHTSELQSHSDLVCRLL